MTDLINNKPVVKKAAEPMPSKNLAQLFDDFQSALSQYKPLIQAVLPAATDVGRFCLLAENMLRKNPKLLECTPRSFWLAILAMAELHLEPVLGHCYPVPYGKTVTMQLGYQGMAQLAWNSGRVVSLWAEVVREGDTFAYVLGTKRDIVHERNSKPGAALRYAYACADLQGGGREMVVLDADEVEARKKVSKTSGFKDGPWQTWPEEMWKKTALRALFKLLPKSVEMHLGVALDDSGAMGRQGLPSTMPSDMPFIAAEEPQDAEVQE